MRQGLIPSRALFVSVALLMAGNGLLGIYLSVFMGLAGWPAPTIGVVMAAYFAGLVSGAFTGGGVIRAVGHIRAFAAFASAATSAALLHGLLTSPAAWLVLRALTGFAVAGLYLVIESWLNAHADARNRGRLFSLYAATSILALGIGQLLLNLGDPHTLAPILLAAVLLALSALPVSLTRAVHPTLPEWSHFGPLDLLRTAPAGALGAFAAGLTGAAFAALAPVYGVRSGLGIGGVSGLMGVAVVGGLLLQWPVGVLSDRLDRVRLIGAVHFGVAIAALGMWWVGGRSLPALLVLAALFGGLSYTLYPLSVAHANDLADRRHFVSVSAGLLLIWGTGSALGPLLAAPAMTLLGPDGLFAYLFFTSAAFGTVATILRRRTGPGPERSPFVTLTRTTPVLSELDPRAAPDDGPAVTPGEP